MSLSFADRRTYFNKCNPEIPVPPNDSRFVTIDARGSDGPRGDDWVNRLAVRIEFSQSTEHLLFTGLPGTGKTTELFRLKARLEDPQKANLLVAMVDVEELLDLRSPIESPDVLLSILFASDAAIRGAEERNPQKALSETPFATVMRWITTVTVEGEMSGKAALGGDLGPAQLGVEGKWSLKADPSLKSLLRSRIALRYGEFLERVRNAFGELNERARTLSFSGLAVIVDSLEKLQGLSSNWEEVLTSAERMFSGDTLRLPVHAVYTVPLALVFRMAETVYFLPMIKLHLRPEPGKMGERFQAGFDAAEALVARRIPDDALSALLGPDWRARRQRIIEASAGYPRQLVRLLQNVCMLEDQSGRAFERLLTYEASTYKRIVPDNAFDWLARVATLHRIEQNDENRGLVAQLLSNNLVLRYCNDDEWFDVHPAVRRVEGVREAIERLEKELEGRRGPG